MAKSVKRSKEGGRKEKGTQGKTNERKGGEITRTRQITGRKQARRERVVLEDDKRESKREAEVWRKTGDGGKDKGFRKVEGERKKRGNRKNG